MIVRGDGSTFQKANNGQVINWPAEAPPGP
jgi:hypothetical protein